MTSKNLLLELATADGPLVEVHRVEDGTPEAARIRFDWTINQPWHLTAEEAVKIGLALIQAALPPGPVLLSVTITRGGAPANIVRPNPNVRDQSHAIPAPQGSVVDGKRIQ